MVTSASSGQPLYDHERPRRRPAPDWGGDELFDAVPRRRFARAAPADEPESAPAVAPRPTVVITGHPGRSAVVARPRASGTASLEQRIHARPDRLAAWAFALGLLLIAIAIATSS